MGRMVQVMVFSSISCYLWQNMKNRRLLRGEKKQNQKMHLWPQEVFDILSITELLFVTKMSRLLKKKKEKERETE